MESLHGFEAMWSPRPDHSADRGLIEVVDWFHHQDRMEERFGGAFRRSIDEVLDGKRTGRYDMMRELEKTEKTYLGTKVEILVRTEFGIQKGQHQPGDAKPMDYFIASHEVDAKFSIYRYQWSIPKEADSHMCLLMHADDHKQKFEVGLLRISDDVLRAGNNQDKKRGIAASSRKLIHWLVDEGELPPNLLLHMNETDRTAVLSADSGQAKVNELFRRIRGTIINREAVEPIATQTDMAKRVRDARLHLADEGIAILGHQERHPIIAEQLGLPVPRKGEWISIRLIPDPGDDRARAMVSELDRVVARDDEPPVPLEPGY